jgi:hypothetical protein
MREIRLESAKGISPHTPDRIGPELQLHDGFEPVAIFYRN